MTMLHAFHPRGSSYPPLYYRSPQGATITIRAMVSRGWIDMGIVITSTMIATLAKLVAQLLLS